MAAPTAVHGWVPKSKTEFMLGFHTAGFSGAGKFSDFTKDNHDLSVHLALYSSSPGQFARYLHGVVVRNAKTDKALREYCATRRKMYQLYKMVFHPGKIPPEPTEDEIRKETWAVKPKAEFIKGLIQFLDAGFETKQSFAKQYIVGAIDGNPCTAGALRTASLIAEEATRENDPWSEDFGTMVFNLVNVNLHIQNAFLRVAISRSTHSLLFSRVGDPQNCAMYAPGTTGTMSSPTDRTRDVTQKKNTHRQTTLSGMWTPK